MENESDILNSVEYNHTDKFGEAEIMMKGDTIQDLKDKTELEHITEDFQKIFSTFHKKMAEYIAPPFILVHEKKCARCNTDEDVHTYLGAPDVCTKCFNMTKFAYTYEEYRMYFLEDKYDDYDVILYSNGKLIVLARGALTDKIDKDYWDKVELREGTKDQILEGLAAAKIGTITDVTNDVI